MSIFDDFLQSLGIAAEPTRRNLEDRPLPLQFGDRATGRLGADPEDRRHLVTAEKVADRPRTRVTQIKEQTCHPLFRRSKGESGQPCISLNNGLMPLPHKLIVQPGRFDRQSVQHVDRNLAGKNRLQGNGIVLVGLAESRLQADSGTTAMKPDDTLGAAD